MEKIEINNLQLKRDYYVNGRPTFKEVPKGELNVFIIDLEIQIRDFYKNLSTKKRQETTLKMSYKYLTIEQMFYIICLSLANVNNRKGVRLWELKMKNL